MTQRIGFRRRFPVPATVVTTLAALAVAAPPAHAAVDVPCDPAALVAAVAAAGASPEPDTLSLAPDCVYTLTAPAEPAGADGLPAIKGELTVHGNRATIRRAPDAPQFRLISNWGALTLDNITLTGGHAPDGVGTNWFGDGGQGGSGGAIMNWGPLTVTDSTLTGNTAGAGAPGPDATATTGAGRGGLGGSGGAISSYDSTAVPLTITNSLITGNTTGVGGRGGNGTGRTPGGRGGSGGFGGALNTTAGTVLRIDGSTISGNAAADGAPGGSGGAEGGGAGDGGSGGTGGGVALSTRDGEPLNPTITGTAITGNRAGRGGDAGVAGPGGYTGWAGFAGSGGGVSVFYDTLTLDGGKVTGNAAGDPGAGNYPLPASGGGIHTLRARVALVNGAAVTDNRPDNCYSVADVPGCVNDGSVFGVQRVDDAVVRDRQAEDLAAAASAMLE